ncbi:hypothetical protein CF645_37745 [Burkholderia pseudomallei]|nr:hypothetical protein CF645_37745 [Burkholderia pseudomallei]
MAVRSLRVALDDPTPRGAVGDWLYGQARDNSTEVVTAGARHVIRTPLKERLQRLDPDRFARVHRGVIVAYATITPRCTRAKRSGSSRCSRSLSGVRITCRAPAVTTSVELSLA